MKSKIFFAVIITMFVTTGAFAQDIEKGDSAKVPGLEWVNVKNLKPVESGNNSFSYDQSCSIQCGGTVTVVGIQGDKLLVRYDIDGKQYGAPCPSGVVFFTTKEKFSSMADTYERVQVEKESEKNLVKKLLGQ